MSPDWMAENGFLGGWLSFSLRGKWGKLEGNFFHFLSQVDFNNFGGFDPGGVFGDVGLKHLVGFWEGNRFLGSVQRSGKSGPTKYSLDWDF